jgi:inorganic pyrophosphatase
MVEYRKKGDAPPPQEEKKGKVIAAPQDDNWSFLDRITNDVSRLPEQTKDAINHLGNKLNASGVVFAGISANVSSRHTNQQNKTQGQQISW